MILFTGELYDMFDTVSIKSKCRHIDTVFVKGSQLPLKLYTIDLNIKNLFKQNPPKNSKKISRIDSLKIEVRETLQSKF